MINIQSYPIKAGDVQAAITALNILRSKIIALYTEMNANQNVSDTMSTKMTNDQLASKIAEIRLLNQDASSIYANLMNLSSLAGKTAGVLSVNAANRVDVLKIKPTALTYPAGVYTGVLKVVSGKLVASKVTITMPAVTAPLSSSDNGNVSYNGLSATTINKLQPYVNPIPTGLIVHYIGNTAPAGWALCNGANIPSTNTYLINLLGSTKLPDLRGLVIRHLDMNGVTDPDASLRVNISGTKVGNVPGSRQMDAQIDHTHNHVSPLSYNSLALTSVVQAVTPPAVTAVGVNNSITEQLGIGQMMQFSPNKYSNVVVTENESPDVLVNMIIKL